MSTPAKTSQRGAGFSLRRAFAGLFALGILFTVILGASSLLVSPLEAASFTRPEHPGVAPSCSTV
jgi:hypothetical protein